LEIDIGQRFACVVCGQALKEGLGYPVVGTMVTQVEPNTMRAINMASFAHVCWKCYNLLLLHEGDINKVREELKDETEH